MNLADYLFTNTRPKLSDYKTDFEKADYLRNILISRCTNGAAYDEDYKFLRNYFLNKADTKTFVPDWVRINRDLASFWQYIKPKIGSYSDRRIYINEEFSQLLGYLEGIQTTPHTDSVDEGLKILNSDYISRNWAKALQRKDTDPDGAITISRTLLEGVLKHILDELNILYPKDTDLHELYKLTATELNLSSEQHNDAIFKQILGGCSGVVTGLSRLRNKLGDAHGQGKINYQPSERHAELAVNLAGAMCLFILKTYELKVGKGGE